MAHPLTLADTDTIEFPTLANEGRSSRRPGASTGGAPHERSRALRLVGPSGETVDEPQGFGDAVAEFLRWVGHSLRVAMWANPASDQGLQVDPAGLRSLIRKSRLALVTTRDRDGNLHSRPMAPTRRLFDGEIWFATPAADPVLDHVRARAPVQVTYLDGEHNRSLVLNGVAQICQRTRNGDILPSWLHRRRNTPSVTYIRVDVMSADVWQ